MHINIRTIQCEHTHARTHARTHALLIKYSKFILNFINNIHSLRPGRQFACTVKACLLVKIRKRFQNKERKKESIKERKKEIVIELQRTTWHTRRDSIFCGLLFLIPLTASVTVSFFTRPFDLLSFSDETRAEVLAKNLTVRTPTQEYYR